MAFPAKPFIPRTILRRVAGPLAVLALVGIVVLSGSRPVREPDEDAPAIRQADREIDRAFELTARSRMLAQSVAETPAPAPTGRNPFAYADDSPGPRGPERPARSIAMPPEAPVQPASPQLALEGVAERNGLDGSYRVAIIGDGSQVFLVKAGDAVGEAFEVVRIESSFVELRNRTTGEAMLLRLR